MVTMSTVWDRTTEFVGGNIAALTPIVLVGMFVPVALIGNLMPLMGASGVVGNTVVGALIVLLSLASNWGAIAVTALGLEPAAGRSVAIRTANRRFLPVIGVNLLVLVILFLLFAPAFIGFSLSGIPMNQAGGAQPSLDQINGPAVLFASLYSLVLLPVLLWVVARLAVITPAVVAERRGFGAFGRAFALTRGLALRIMGVILLYLIVSQVAGLATRMVAGSVFGLLLSNDGPVSLAAILTSTVVAVVSTIFSVLAVAFLAKLYLATRDARAAHVEVA
ncbi:hypothetical protein [Sphingomonas sp. PAMC 26617]|uniref:hypothetical protein n=1 Tax=Sphingomonas sp. PAMC 26617 TaxID=1112216 RepID=UPI000289D9D6|nr:hypothetical protein [Sphingomonas sp. PAMC 26617]